MKNLTSITLLFAIPFLLSACNLFGGLSSPSNDEQHLVAARACLDRNDYPCALDHYRALSDSLSDIKINETSLAQLGQAQVFSFSDLITSLGTSLGNGKTFSSMAELIARRNVATSASRVLIQQTYANNDQISLQNPKLKAFSKFISALAMFNTVLASAAGPDGVLTASDIASGGIACATDATPTLVACGSTANLPDGGNNPIMSASANWSGTPALDMLFNALNAANTEIVNFSGSGSGILSAIAALDGLASEGLKRQQLILTLGLQ
ncbi:MAG: hypothetical protein KGP28_06925 [Bdellovibrionales bacterium]|nr:hypothetical protein [Bdellovibrionales bacterium]